MIILRLAGWCLLGLAVRLFWSVGVLLAIGVAVSTAVWFSR